MSRKGFKMKDKIIELIKECRVKSEYLRSFSFPNDPDTIHNFITRIKRRIYDHVADSLEEIIRDEYPEDDWREDR